MGEQSGADLSKQALFIVRMQSKLGPAKATFSSALLRVLLFVMYTMTDNKMKELVKSHSS